MMTVPIRNIGIDLGLPAQPQVDEPKLFLEFSRVFNAITTLADTVSELHVAPTFSGSMTLVEPTGFRIRADFSSTPQNLRAMFQSSTLNGLTAVEVIPNGSSTGAQLNVTNNSDPLNGNTFQFRVSALEAQILNLTRGTATAIPFVLYMNGLAEALRIDTALHLSSKATVRAASYTVATLPVGVQGMRAQVTDALIIGFLLPVVGGGGTTCPVFYDGAAWVCA